MINWKSLGDIVLIYIVAVLVFIGICWMVGHYFFADDANILWSMTTAVATCLLVASAIVGFKKARDVNRMNASLQFCNTIHKKFQSRKFKALERRICTQLNERDSICAISDLPEDLQKDIKIYCGFMDNIGVLTKQRFIQQDVVISYHGTELLLAYDLIKPYIDMERKTKADNFRNFRIPKEDTELIRSAIKLQYAHFELLALLARERGPRLVKDFNKSLRRKKAI